MKDSPDKLASPAPLAVEGVTMDFPPVRALDGVSLAFERGKVRGIIGENGAGKSTLMKIIAGIYKPTAGAVMLNGASIQLAAPADAIRLGIAMVHQELNLVEELTVADNIFLGRQTRFISRRAGARAARVWLDKIGSALDPNAKVRTLSIAQQQMVEIAKALSQQASVLILDEPTAVLTRVETDRLFGLIRRLKADGVIVLYISHILPEVLEICDDITVMRDGRVVRTLARSEAPAGPAAEAMLSALMVGRELGDQFPPRGTPGATVLSVRGLDVEPAVRGVTFDVRAGEVLGLSGLIGAGRTELAEGIAGLRRRTAGEVVVGGKNIAPNSIHKALNAGVAYLSEDRRGRGLVIGRNIRDNVTLVSLRKYVRLGLVSSRRQRQATEAHVRRLGIRAGSPDDPIETLSGGNQQKVALAKWLEAAPRVLILDEPTRGVDVGAKAEIYRLIAQLAADGMACLLVSSELNELLGMCHRIGVMRAGRIVRMLEGDEMTEGNVMLAAAGVGECGKTQGAVVA
jgi:ribose transport system ATP-binding protein